MHSNHRLHPIVLLALAQHVHFLLAHANGSCVFLKAGYEELRVAERRVLLNLLFLLVLLSHHLILAISWLSVRLLLHLLLRLVTLLLLSHRLLVTTVRSTSHHSSDDFVSNSRTGT